MKALIRKDGLVAEVRETEFPVHPDLKWVDCDETIKASAFTWDGQRFHEIPLPTRSPRLVADDAEDAACRSDNTIMSLINQTRAEWVSWAGNNFPSLTSAEKTRLGTLFWVVAIGVRKHLR